MEGAMFNFKKIALIMLVAALFCALQIGTSYAQEILPNNTGEYNYGGDWMGNNNFLKNIPGSNSGSSLEDCKKTCTQKGYGCVLGVPMSEGKYVCVKTDPTSTTNTNPKQSTSAVTGCSSNQGIFSGLIATGSKVFNGLRDLIYVVAGFGIIGVAVGGFFGNLNWKWLGAIVISLVVIATTGELISAITGCENFTNAMITDTLKY